MFEMLNKESFPLLPFGPDIPYLTINSCSDDIQQNCLNENEVDIFPPDETFIEQIEIQQKKGTKKKKTFVKLNEKAANFRYSFYKMFTSKKKFPKKFVCQIHNEIRSRLRLKKSHERKQDLLIYISFITQMLDEKYYYILRRTNCY